jgi:hypothetical protein
MKKTLLFLSIIAILATGCSTTTTTTTSSGDTTEAGGSAPSGPARDGRFEFKVKSVKCGATTMGKGFMAAKAQGEFCVVNLDVSNIGKEAQMFDASSQYAFDASGSKFDASTDAMLATKDLGNAFLNEINPGNSVDGVIVFDVPKGTTIDHLELHDSMFSDGVQVGV